MSGKVTVVVVHGSHGGQRRNMHDLAVALSRAGYSVLETTVNENLDVAPLVLEGVEVLLVTPEALAGALLRAKGGKKP